MNNEGFEIPGDLSIPVVLKREDTPESKAAREAFVAKANRKPLTLVTPEKPVRSEKELREARIRDEADNRWRNWLPTEESRTRPSIAAYRKEVRKEFDTKRAKKENEMSATAKKVGPKEAQIRQRRETPDKLKEITNGVEAVVGVRKPRAKDSFTPEQKAKLEAQRKEHLKAANGATKVKAKAGSLEALFEQNGMRVMNGEKHTINFKLMQFALAHPKGFEWDAIAKHVEWTRANWAVGELCKKLKYDLSEKDGKVYVAKK